MLWSSTSDEVVGRMLADINTQRKMQLKAFTDEAGRWKPAATADAFDKHMQARLDLYVGQQLPYLKQALATHFPQTHRELQPYYANVVRHLIDERARVFLNSGQFDLMGVDGEAMPEESPAVERWENIREGMNGVGLLHRLKRADRWTLLFNTVVAEACWDECCGLPKLHLYPPHKVWVAFNPDLPCSLQAAAGVLLEVTSGEGVDAAYATGMNQEHRRFKFYSANPNAPLAFVVDGNGKLIETEDNPKNEMEYRDADGTPRIPLVAFCEHDEEMGFFSVAGCDLFDWQQSWNVALTDLHHIASHQGFGELFLENTNQGAGELQGTIVRGPTRATKLSGGWAAKMLSANPIIAELMQLQETDVKRMATLTGIPPGRILADSRGVASGDALEIEERPLMELREDRIETFRPRIDELFQILRMVNNAHASGADLLPEDAWMRWSPGEISIPRDAEKQTRVTKARIDLGLTDPIEVLMEERGIGEEEAQALYEKHKQRAGSTPRMAASLAAAVVAPSLRKPMPPEPKPGEPMPPEPTPSK